ncbi:MAG: FAD/NAD(P)-binding oxidoreductase [Armatimonadota bacterium]|nr:FAD/NAD(P)-binding oxidoreductase [Armatimonadota bacterium]MDR7451742.1 FAD/NAD(P)-binding oxidoreductase [Armatimonadota bacterium]MDR7467367.1 FAD/NAD(P)-binding oxidoreductase [Armatimonadota bacterium]MDR7494137.1 FAD/NAD(P)-binding oxidoreductase [Armatimonadota bacterium]MDR7498897.1 FAD/NAD(P)-binding oxidoreductase [Armatimonadota bacterium]
MKIVILGGGFGGITAAVELSRALGREHAITVIERAPVFMMGLRKLWMVTGRGTRREGERVLAHLRADGVRVVQETVLAIDSDAREVRTDAGRHAYDYLIVALGAEPRPDLVPGFSSSAYNLYGVADAERLGARLREFTGGRIVIAILGVPYKCPPAPYEAAMLLDDLFRRRGMRGDVQIQVCTPQPMSLPVVGAQNCAQVEGLLAARGIVFSPNRKVARLEGSTAVFEDGTRLAADLLMIVPPHRPPAAIENSGLPKRGIWVAVDPATLRTSVEGVFAVGDVNEIPLATGLPLPKAGLFAEAQARVAAQQIVAELRKGPPPSSFDGVGYCFIETGGGMAALVQGQFLAAPHPAITIAPPSAAAYAQKIEFERSRLTDWFGP